MKKWFVIIFAAVVIINGFGTLAKNIDDKKLSNERNIIDHITVDSTSLHCVETNAGYLELRLGPEEVYLLNPGQPMMPRVLRIFELPFGATNIKVSVETQNIHQQTLSGQIRPAPVPQPYTPQPEMHVQSKKDTAVYTRNALYPSEWFSHHVGCGLNAEGQRVTHLVINCFPVRYNPVINTIMLAEQFDISIHYDDPVPVPTFFEETYDLVIIHPPKFSSDVERLVTHKTAMGVPTIAKTTNEIYTEYPAGNDEPEQIKLFIQYAIETWDVQYVLLFGGLKSILYAKAKDDINHGASGWHVPVRYSNFQWDGDPSYNFTSGEPGYVSDLYYADVYKEGGVFDNWDSNGNGVYAEWSGDLRDDLDLYPDVAVGRLACRNTREAQTVVDKIITYETTTYGQSWFNKIIVISGDGFLDQSDWDMHWDTTGLPDGEYTIHAQSSNPEAEVGPIDEIQITLDKTVATNITFNHDDHLNPALADGYPAPPITEIVSVSNGNTLGNTDYTFIPDDGEAYCNDFYYWANISYIDGVLTIRGKSYDPKPYGNLTDFEVWITDENDTVVWSDSRQNTETYFEGEWVVGEKLLRGRGGALAYMPGEFESNSVFTSNGKWFDQSDVIDEFSKGYGLAYFSGHGSPGWWGDHYPGIPGNRRYGQVAGLVVSQFSLYFPFFKAPALPMRKLVNTDMLPVVCVGGCHNSMITVSLIPSILNRYIQNYMFTYGTPTPECWGWYMVKLPRTGAIATMGNTGYGWGSEGDVCTIGTGDGWLNTEFFRQYGVEGQDVLGMTYSQALTSYISHHMTFELEYWRIDRGWDGIDQKTVQQWELLGDPSLLIGGYP